MNTTSYLIMMLVAITGILGFTTFGVDLGEHYSTDFSSNMTAAANNTLDRLQNMSNTFEDIFSDDNTWEQTAFSIFFTLPANIMALIVDMPTMASTLVHAGAEDMGILIPWWVVPILGTILTLIVFIIIVSILFNRSDT